MITCLSSRRVHNPNTATMRIHASWAAVRASNRAIEAAGKGRRRPALRMGSRRDAVSQIRSGQPRTGTPHATDRKVTGHLAGHCAGLWPFPIQGEYVPSPQWPNGGRAGISRRRAQTLSRCLSRKPCCSWTSPAPRSWIRPAPGPQESEGSWSAVKAVTGVPHRRVRSPGRGPHRSRRTDAQLPHDFVRGK